MTIQFEIDEAKIQELAQTNSMEDLPRAIFNQARYEATQQVVNQIKNESLIKDKYYSGKEEISNEVVDLVMKKIGELIKDLVTKQFSEEKISMAINRAFDRVFTEWIEKKAYEKLEKIKADLCITSYGEMEAEREAEARAHQDEIERLTDR